MKVFLRLGIKAVSMDDLARELAMSKKTLYKHFTDKRDLVRKGMDLHCTELEEVFCNAAISIGNAIDGELIIMRHIHEMLSQMNPNILFDLHKYYPKAFNELEIRRSKMLSEAVIRNLERGQSEGIYRLDFDPGLAARFLVGVSQSVREAAKQMGHHRPLSELYLESAMYHIHAIASPKGRAYFEKKMASDPQFNHA